ncbi:MAG: hypothetical protein WC797_01860 [Candidatus Paceibacterota bacterium]|jgi:hypothetical protein
MKFWGSCYFSLIFFLLLGFLFFVSSRMAMAELIWGGCYDNGEVISKTHKLCNIIPGTGQYDYTDCDTIVSFGCRIKYVQGPTCTANPRPADGESYGAGCLSARGIYTSCGKGKTLVVGSGGDTQCAFLSGDECPSGKKLITDSAGKYCAGTCINGGLVLRDGKCPAVCGNGIEEEGEKCDEGNKNGAIGKCSTSCKLNKVTPPTLTVNPTGVDGSGKDEYKITSGQSIHVALDFIDEYSLRYYKTKNPSVFFVSTSDTYNHPIGTFSGLKYEFDQELLAGGDSSVFTPTFYPSSPKIVGPNITVDPKCKYLAGNNKDDKLKKYALAVLAFDESELQRIGDEIYQSLISTEPYKSNKDLFIIRGMLLGDLQSGSDKEKQFYDDLTERMALLSPTRFYLDLSGESPSFDSELQKLCPGSDLTILFKDIKYKTMRDDGVWGMLSGRSYSHGSFTFFQDDSLTTSSIFQHEIGHAWGLDDEYVEPSMGNLLTTIYKENNMISPNCATSDDIINGTVPWKNLLSGVGVSISSAVDFSGYGKVAYFTGNPGSCFMEGLYDIQKRARKNCFFATEAEGQQIAFQAVGNKDICDIRYGYNCMVATKVGSDVSYECLSQKDGSWGNCGDLDPRGINSTNTNIGGCAYVTENIRPTLSGIMNSGNKTYGLHGYGLVDEKWICDRLKKLMPSTACPRYSE